MERIYDKKEIADYIAKSKYHAALDALDIDFYLIKYEKGELVSSPFQNELLFQIAEQGSINIYLIRDDGTRYSLSTGTADHFSEIWTFFIKKTAIFMPKLRKDWSVLHFLLKNIRKFYSLIINSLYSYATAFLPKSERSPLWMPSPLPSRNGPYPI